MKTQSVITTLVASAAITAAASGDVTSLVSDELQYFRPANSGGVNTFETFQYQGPEFDGMIVKVGGHFTQQFQALDHETNAVAPGGGDPLIEIGNGFNLATANLNLDAQLTEGVRMHLVTYLSSRHHPETWVKDGYVQIDRSPIESEMLDSLFDNLSVRLGHMEINYGDMHFRRTDNANAMYNPFVGNLIMDAFTTEIGGEVYAYNGPIFGMVGITEGEIQGGITRPSDRSPSYYAKVGYDERIGENLRVRLTGSVYTTDSSINNTLYGGDRTGSRYYLVLENPGASTSSNFTSGRFNPGFRDELTAMVINPFVKFHNFEFFGNIERAKGKASFESAERSWDQNAAELLYRFLPDNKAYAGIRWNEAKGDLLGQTEEASIERIQVGAGWFVNRNMLLKAEYVVQDYDNFMGAQDLRNGGKFNGFMVEAVLGF